MPDKEELIEQEVEREAANTIQNILGKVGAFIYGTRAKCYAVSAQSVLGTIELDIQNYNRLVGMIREQKK